MCVRSAPTGSIPSGRKCGDIQSRWTISPGTIRPGSILVNPGTRLGLAPDPYAGVPARPGRKRPVRRLIRHLGQVRRADLVATLGAALHQGGEDALVSNVRSTGYEGLPVKIIASIARTRYPK